MTFGMIALIAITALMSCVWLVSVGKKDAGIVDVFWGLGFGLIALLALLRFPDMIFAAKLLYGLVIIWAVRLALHLARRWLGEAEEDKRYQSMRRRAGNLFWIKSLVTVFALQGTLILLIAQPLIHLPAFLNPPAVPVAFYIFLAIGALGLGIETVADIQLTRFRALGQGGILNTGLWARSRHPNYFGDALHWWGVSLAVIALAPELIWTLFAPLVMNILLVKISGAELLEKYMAKKEGYAAYQAQTNRFIPRILP